MHVHILDRVLDRHDVQPLLLVDLVDHGGERGRLTRAGGTRDEDEALALAAHVREHGRQAQLVEAHHLVGNEAIHRRHAPTLHEQVAAKARHPLHAEGEVELVRLLERDLLFFGELLVSQSLRLARGERGYLSGMMCPSMRRSGALPAVMCKSLAPFSTITFKSCWREKLGRPPWAPRFRIPFA